MDPFPHDIPNSQHFLNTPYSAHANPQDLALARHIAAHSHWPLDRGFAACSENYGIAEGDNARLQALVEVQMGLGLATDFLDALCRGVLPGEGLGDTLALPELGPAF